MTTVDTGPRPGRPWVHLQWILWIFALLATIVPTFSPGDRALAGQDSEPAVTIRAPEPREEFRTVWLTLKKMAFFREHGYRVHLPDHQAFQTLAARDDDLTGVDPEKLSQVFVNHVYDRGSYQAGLETLMSAGERLRMVFPAFEAWQAQWSFYLPPHYNVVLTLYGTGGYYHPATGRIILMTTPAGRFKRVDPVHTIVHEMVHIGIQKNIVERFKLSHLEKERLVDLICSIRFGDILPDYRLQPQGARGLDDYITRDALNDLPSAVAAYCRRTPSLTRGAGGHDSTLIDAVIIRDVLPGSKAEKIGLQRGDIILRYHGLDISNPRQLADAVGRHQDQKRIDMIVLRDGGVRRYTVPGGAIGVWIDRTVRPKERDPRARDG